MLTPLEQSASSLTLLKDPIKSRQIKTANYLYHATSLIYSTFRYYFLNTNKVKPSAILAGIPIPSVTELSGAVSDQILRYRARGGIFLAHQDSAGHESLRIVGNAYGPNRFIFLSMLEFLFNYGSNISVDFSQNITNVSDILLPQVDLNVTTDPWVKFEATNPDEGIEEMHLTFPIVTKNRIYLNMYIETYQYIQSVEFGKDVIEYTIFFRKYDAYPKYDFGYMTNPKTEEKEYYYKQSTSEGFLRKLLSSSYGFFASIYFKTITLLQEGTGILGDPDELAQKFLLGFVGG